MNDKEDTLLETAVRLKQILIDWIKSLISVQRQKQVVSHKKPASPIIERSKFDDLGYAPSATNVQQNGSTTISVNGVSYSGNVVGIKNSRVMVDGNVINTSSDKIIKIDISGDVSMLAVDACDYIKITGNASKVETMSGDVYCGDVDGDVKTMSGSVTCGNIAGDVETMSGNIRRK